jgi:succinylglutamate desuccinylase
MNQEIPEQPEILIQLRQKAAELRKIQSLQKEMNKNHVASLAKSS